MEKVFITGGSGLLGSAVAVAFREKCEVTYNYNHNPLEIENCKGVRLDITYPRQLEYLKNLKPKIVIHCAGLIGVDYCEEHKQETYNINVQATENIAKICRDIGAKLVYISTDYVFDGERGMYREEEEPRPINYYGESKLLGERKALDNEDALVVRTSIHGWNPVTKSVQFGKKQSFSEMILNKLKNKEEVKLFADQFNSPVLTNDLAQVLLKLVEKDVKGIIHASCSDRASKFEFGLALAEIFGIENGNVVPNTAKNMVFKVPRPRDVSLSTNLIKEKYGISMPTVEESLKNMRKLQDDGYLKNFKVVQDDAETGC